MLERKITEKKEISTLVVLFTLTYMVSYITRINYGAIISEVESDTGISRSLLSVAVTGSFITYGLGQIISGILGDIFSPKKMVSLGFVITVAMNLLMPLFANPYLMLVVWCVNGFAQSFMWPPMVRLMSVLLSDEDYKTASTKVSFGASFGTIAVYLVSPLLISIATWRSVFVFSAVCGIICLFFWNRFCTDVKTEKRKEEKEEGGSATHALFTPVVFCIMLAIVMQGMLRDGVTTWMPTYISETYNLGNSISILTGVIMPLFSIACLQIASGLYQKKIKNAILCSALILGGGALSAIALYFFSGSSAVLSVLFSALIIGCMHGANLMLVCMVPNAFKKYGKVSTVSGVINACTYVGSAASTYGIALVSEKFGWSVTIGMWVLIATVGALLCLICTRKWKQQYQTEE